MRYLQRIPLALIALTLVLLPMLVHLVQDWYALPLPYGKTFGTSDPDSWVRLTVVRELLISGNWYGHAVLHSGAPFFQTVTPWTRPLDVVISFFVKLQPADVDLQVRLLRAALILPILWMGLLLLGIYRAVRQLCTLPIAPLMATVLAASVPVIRNYFTTGNADHHAPLACVFIWAFGGVLHPAPSARLTVCTGLLLGLLLWISPEGMVLIAAVFGWYGLLWLLGDTVRAKPLPLLSTSTALMCVVAVMIERAPDEWLTPIYDSISIVYTVILLSIALVTHLLFRLPLPTWQLRLAAAGLGVTATAALVLSLYPAMIDGPLTGLDPYIYTTFLPKILETQPLFHKHMPYIAAMLLQPLITLAFLALAWRHTRRMLTQTQLAQLAYFVAVTLGLYLTQQRFYYYFDPVVIVALTPFLSALMMPEHPSVRNGWPASWLTALPPKAQMLRRLPLLLFILGTPMALITLPATHTSDQSRRINSCEYTARQMIQGGVLTQAFGAESLTVLLSTNLGGETLFFTPHSIVASNYHREGPGIRYVWEADTITDPKRMREYLGLRNIGALLICPVTHPPKNSFLQQLQRHEIVPPAWLTLVPYTLPPEDPDEPRVKDADPALFLIHRPQQHLR